MNRPDRWLTIAWAMLWLLPCGGCATRDSGYKISDETVAFIQPRATTRSEVVDNLGPPLLELKELHVLAYSWGKVRATGGNPVLREETMQARQSGYATVPPPSEGTGLVEARRWLFCVECDANDRVQRTERIKLEGAASLEQVVRNWAVGKQP